MYMLESCTLTMTVLEWSMDKGVHQLTVDPGHGHAREHAIHLECKLETINMRNWSRRLSMSQFYDSSCDLMSMRSSSLSVV